MLYPRDTVARVIVVNHNKVDYVSFTAMEQRRRGKALNDIKSDNTEYY